MLDLVKPAFEMVFILRQALLQLWYILPLDKFGSYTGYRTCCLFNWSFLLVSLFVLSLLDRGVYRFIRFKNGALTWMSREKVLLYHQLHLYWLWLLHEFGLCWRVVCSNFSLANLVHLRFHCLLVFRIASDAYPSLASLGLTMRRSGFFRSVFWIGVCLTCTDLPGLPPWGAREKLVHFQRWLELKLWVGVRRFCKC